MTTLALALAGGATFALFLASSERSIVAQSSERREAVARQVEARVHTELQVASHEIDDVERAIQAGALDVDDPEAVEARLFSEILDHPTLSDVTLTRQTDGAFMWQVLVFRPTAEGGGEVWTRRIRGGRERVSEIRRRPRGGALRSAPFVREEGAADDPTKHDTYAASLEPKNYGRAIWSDLSYSELDRARPESERRVVLTVQKAIEDTPKHLVGVARAGLLERTIDVLPGLSAHDVDPDGVARAFLCDPHGRLLTRLEASDPLVLMDNDLRVDASHAPPEIAVALAHAGESRRFEARGVPWLVTFATVARTQEWLVGIVVPEAHYTRELRSLRSRFLAALAVLTALTLFAGAALLRPIRRSLARVVDATTRMRGFDLAPASTDAPLREVTEVMEGVERAKTSMRALGKYVPMDLVRQLYTANEEPRLGGELVDLSLMFTDIEGFTDLAERLEPHTLARALGDYLEAMTAGVRSTKGTVDKFIGDAVMAFWNAPRPLPDHAVRACRAALACRKATRVLFASAAWDGLPPLVTRYGLHTGRVLVGHFGAPERFSYTALGDGVNLAARLEGLCKQYGVVTLVSEAIMRAAGEGFSFRVIDKVAVKGKKQAVLVYELLEEPRPELAAYEEAFAAYLGRDFARARELLHHLPDDPPSRILAARCEAMLGDSPPPDWDGVYVAKTK
jgi:adenylate cyclase